MKRKLTLVAALWCGLTACNDDFLNVPNPMSGDTGSYFRSQPEVDEAVVAVYSALMHQGLFARDWYFDFDLLANEATRQSPLQGQLVEIAAGTYDANNDQVRNKWKALYRVIIRSHFVLSVLEKWQPEQPQYEPLKARYEGEARFFLGFSYYYLAALWGDVPLRTGYEETTAQLHLARTPRNQVLAYAAGQLVRAAALLPDRYPNPADNGRVTAWAARAYLGLVHLQGGKFAEARPLFEEIVGRGGFAAWPGPAGFARQFGEDNRSSPESVWQILHAHWPAESHAHTHWGHWENNWGTGKTASSARSIEYGFNDWRNVDVARSLVYQFKYDLVTPAGAVENYVDPRAALTFYGDEGYGGDPDFAGGTFPFDQLKNWYWKKYQRYETLPKEDNPDSRISGQLVRLHTVRLLLAECLIMGGDYPAALAQINAVRERAGAAPYADLPRELGTALYIRPGGETDPRTRVGAMTLLMREKALELAGEQQRWFDLVRWHHTWPGFRMPDLLNYEKEVNELAPDGKPEPAAWRDKHLLLPIPQNEKDVNRLIAVPDGWNGTDLEASFR